MNQPNPANNNIYDRVVPFEVEWSHELAAQRNVADEPNRQVVIDREHISKTAVRVFLKHVQYGSFNNQPATFFALKSHFIFDDKDAIRFTAAEINIQMRKTTFRGAAKGDESPEMKNRKGRLEVAALCPRKIYGNLTRNDRKWRYGFSVPISWNIGAVLGVSPSVELESAYPKDCRMTISGSLVLGGARWKLTENEIQKSGIPDQFTCAAVVPFDVDDGGFQAHVSIKISTNLPMLSLRAMPWSMDDPIIFKADHNFGTLAGLESQFEKLTEEHWKIVVDYPTEFQVEFSFFCK